MRHVLVGTVIPCLFAVLLVGLLLADTLFPAFVFWMTTHALLVLLTGGVTLGIILVSALALVSVGLDR